MATSTECREPSLPLSNSVKSTGDFTVYTGISNRSRGWKSRKNSHFMDGRIPPSANIKRWDGGAKACAAWDSLRMDPELWFDNGNCFVHLYGKGQSRRGPAFRVPLSTLLEANCHPLLNRYLARNVPGLRSPYPARDSCNGSDMEGRVDLYISPPPMADRKQLLNFYLSVRNLFAWICRRSLVGEHLGSALIALKYSMQEYRSPGTDNVEDILSYCEDEGYLDLGNQPIHALAMVHLAEHYQLRDLYINAFAHCAGMGDCLYTLPEYQAISSITRKLLRRAQAGVESKLSRAATSLKDFLEDDLSESNLGLAPGGRAHLERFRSFLLAFYTHRLGYYPPSPVDTRTCMWEPEIYRAMRIDFEALYEYLVDWTYTTSDSSSLSGRGGICVLQSVHSFDLRHKYKPLPHPLPRLPEVAPTTTSKRTSWFSKGDSKLRPDQRLLSHAALVKATNSASQEIATNGLVAAYKRFEEDSLSSRIRFDKIEKLSQVDARKIRWILIYGVYQTLRGCTEAPLEVRDTNSAGYSLAISTTHLPPWKEQGRRCLTRTRSQMSATSPVPSLPSSGVSTPMSMEIKPDIDYFALAHRSDSVLSKSMSGTMPPYQIPPRSGSLSKALSRTGSLRRSLGSLRGESRRAPAIEPSGPRRSVAYHEIVVHGYGNGTNEVQVEHVSPDSSTRPGLANRSPSTSSNSSAGSTANASVTTPRSEESWDSVATSIPEEADKPTTTTTERRGSVASNHTTSSSVYSTPDDDVSSPPPVPQRSSKRQSVVVVFDKEAQPAPLQIRKAGARLSLPDDPALWRAIEDDVDVAVEAVPEGKLEMMDDDEEEEVPEWDHFADVGGLTAV
ncbi:hypothetical protein GE09DRAFT_692196 [Coniochaeta sp. 2T2.1]|nr:hypothetical protein GE09DRAFT_692196 [Coniochaeta sp. 2T2.1]